MVYLGPPDFHRVDRGSSFVSYEFLSLAQTDGISVLHVPTGSPETMRHAKSYHGPLRSAYLKIKSDLPKMSHRELLQMAVKAVNDTTGPEALCPTQLVF